jgi:hypothetical protein
MHLPSIEIMPRRCPLLPSLPPRSGCNAAPTNPDRDTGGLSFFVSDLYKILLRTHARVVEARLSLPLSSGTPSVHATAIQVVLHLLQLWAGTSKDYCDGNADPD